jgi:hypothetical protein
MNLHTLSGLARAIDFKFATNRAIAAICITVFLSMLAYTADPKLGLYSAISVFFAWALARELDPDHDFSAFIAVALALPFLSFPGAGAGPMFWTLLIVRVLNRSTGVPSNPLDVGLILFLAYGNPYLLGLSALAMAIDTRINPRTLSWYSAAVLLGLAMIAGSQSTISLYWTPLLAVPCILAIPASTTARTDATDQPLDPQRVRAAQIVAALSLAAAQPSHMLPILAAFLATALYCIGSRLFLKSP